MEARDGEAGPSGRGGDAAATVTKRNALANAGSSSPVAKRLKVKMLAKESRDRAPAHGSLLRRGRDESLFLPLDQRCLENEAALRL